MLPNSAGKSLRREETSPLIVRESSESVLFRTTSGHMSLQAAPAVVFPIGGPVGPIWFRPDSSSSRPLSPSAVRPQLWGPQAKYAVHVTLVCCKDLPRYNLNLSNDSSVIDPYVSISVIENSYPSAFSSEDMRNLDHSDGEGGSIIARAKPTPNQQALSKIQALYTSRPVLKNANPTWNESFDLKQAFVAEQLRAPLDSRKPVVPKAKVKGQDLLLLLTIRDMDLFNADEFVGRVVIPSIASGEVLSQWFPLESKDGKAVLGARGEKSMVQLKIEYRKEADLELTDVERERVRERERERGRSELNMHSKKRATETDKSSTTLATDTTLHPRSLRDYEIPEDTSHSLQYSRDHSKSPPPFNRDERGSSKPNPIRTDFNSSSDSGITPQASSRSTPNFTLLDLDFEVCRVYVCVCVCICVCECECECGYRWASEFRCKCGCRCL